MSKKAKTLTAVATLAALGATIASLTEQLTAAQAALPSAQAAAEVEKANAAFAERFLTGGLEAGSVVHFDYGRPKAGRTGVVRAYRPASDTVPALYRVEIGEGFDTELVSVPARDIKGVQDDTPAASVDALLAADEGSTNA